MRDRSAFDLPAAFYEDDIFALQELDANERYVPLRRVCARLGLALDDTLLALRGHALLASGLRNLGADGPALRVDLLPLWLALLDPRQVGDDARERLVLYQRESASVLWQAFKPQGFGPEDALLPERSQMTPAEQAYQGMMAQAALARQQMLIERQLDAAQADGNRRAAEAAPRSGPAFDLARLVRRIAHGLAARTRRNEYAGIYSGLYRQFGISSYCNMPRGRLLEATEWLERWHGDIMGEPEPPPDI